MRLLQWGKMGVSDSRANWSRTDHVALVVPLLAYSILPNHACLTAACHAKYHVISENAADASDDSKVVDTYVPCKFWD